MYIEADPAHLVVVGRVYEGSTLVHNPARLVAVGRVYEGSTLVHNTPLLPGQVKVSVDEVKDADAPVPVPTAEVSLVGQALHTFLAWPTHLIKSLSHQVLIVLTICFFFLN